MESVSLRVVVIGEDPLARAGLAALVAQREELSIEKVTVGERTATA
jgi:hypothetical protein